MAYGDILKNKMVFVSMISEKYPEINWKRMLIALVARDDDLL